MRSLKVLMHLNESFLILLDSNTHGITYVHVYTHIPGTFVVTSDFHSSPVSQAVFPFYPEKIQRG